MKTLAVVVLLVVVGCAEVSSDVCDHIDVGESGVSIDDCAASTNNVFAISRDEFDRPVSYSFDVECSEGPVYGGAVSGITRENGVLTSALVTFFDCEGEGAFTCDQSCSWTNE